MPSSRGSATNRGRRSGTFTRANFVRPLCSTTTARFLLRFETSGNGWPGSNASGVRTGQTSTLKCLLEIRAVVVGVVGGVDDVDALARELADAASSARIARARRACAVARSLARESRLVEAHHEELVEVVRGNPEKLDALEQRMAGPGLLEHPVVEREPCEVAVEIERRIPQDRAPAGGSAAVAGRRRPRRAVVGLMPLPTAISVPSRPKGRHYPGRLPGRPKGRHYGVSKLIRLGTLMNALANLPSPPSATPS